MSENKEIFEVKVAEIYRRGNKTKYEAIKEAAARYPELHVEFLERLQKNPRAHILEEALTR
jgi:hypothetical protein